MISQQNLRKHGKEAYLWDTRNGMCLCESAHRQHDLAVARVPYRYLTSSHKAFARDMELEYLLDRYYPKEKRMEVEKIDVRLDPVVSDNLAVVDGIIVEAAPLHATEVIDGPAHNREKCPTCERPLPKPHQGEEEKVRKGWTIAVPVAELEDGAETLDTLMEECRKLFGHDEHKKVRFYTLSQALALVVQNGHKLAADA